MSRTKYTGDQIALATLDNTHIAAAAAILTSKLAEGSLFIKADGSLAWTGDQSMGNHKITSLTSGVGNNDAVNVGQMNAAIALLNSVFKMKPDARAASTGNVNIANPGTNVFDGVTLVVGEILMVRANTAPAENGLYTFNGSGVALTRISQMDAWNEVPGAITTVDEGSVWADTMWLCTSNAGGTLGTTAINWQQIPTTAGLTNSNYVDKEAVGGTINGVNTAFTIANTPVAGSEHLFYNGQLLQSGAGNDYTISGANITMLFAPLTGAILLCSYRK